MAEISRIPTQQQIKDAQEKFAGRFYKEARNEVRGLFAEPIDLISFYRSATPARHRGLAAAEIYVNASIRQANNEASGAAVAKELVQAKRVFHQFVDNTRVQAIARILSTEERNYVTEMRKAKIAYTLTLVSLTGNTALLSDAISELDGWIKEERDPTESTLLVFNRECLRHRMERTNNSFDTLTAAYTTAEHQRRSVGKWQDAAVISARFIAEVGEDQDPRRRDGRAVVEAYTLYDSAVDGHDDAPDFLASVRKNKEREKHRSAMWKYNSPRSVDYSHLALSNRTQARV